MKSHTKLYLEHFEIMPYEAPCEVCGAMSVDVHHIKNRGMGGSKNQDRIENLMALCRDHHIELGDKKQHLQFLKMVHDAYIEYQLSFAEKYGRKITQWYIDNPNKKML